VLEQLGGFDEYYHRAQDWELNLRIRQAGGVVWFSPDLSVTYRPRSSVTDLAHQFFRTGQWRREVIKRYPDTVALRYVAAPVATAVIAAGSVAGLAGVAGPDWLLWGWLAPTGYLGGVLAASLAEGRDLSARGRAWLPLVLSTMHISWGTGFLFGTGGVPVRRRARPTAPRPWRTEPSR